VAGLLNAGADKISINSVAVKNNRLISNMAKMFGSQCVVVAIDTAFINDEWLVFTSGGRVNTGISCVEWAKRAEEHGAGEILLTSIGSDGTRNGFSLGITGEVCHAVNIPVIASGGAGTKEHFRDVFTLTRATGALAASVFHYGDITIRELKDYLKSEKIAIR